MPRGRIDQLECSAGVHSQCEDWKKGRIRNFFSVSYCGCLCHKNKENLSFFALADEGLNWEDELRRVMNDEKVVRFPYGKDDDYKGF